MYVYTHIYTHMIPPITDVTDGALGERQGEAKKKLASDLWKRFFSEVSGTHIG